MSEEEGYALLFGESFAGSTPLCRSCEILSGFIKRAISFSTSFLSSHYSSLLNIIFFSLLYHDYLHIVGVKRYIQLRKG